MERSEQINELAQDLAKAQGEMLGASKDSRNPFFSSKYADLASVIAAVKEPLSRNNISYAQLIEDDEKGWHVKTMLMHKSGQFISSVMKIIPGYYNKDNVFISKTDMQSLGSAITYARRYSLMAILGIPAEDDDGEAAVGRAQLGKPEVKMPTQNNKQNAPVPAGQVPAAVEKVVLEAARKVKQIQLEKLAIDYFKGARSEFLKFLGEYGCEKVSEMTEEQCDKAIIELKEKQNAK